MLNKGRSVLCPVFGTFVPAASYIQAQALHDNVNLEDSVSQVSGAITKENLFKLESTNVCYAPGV